MQVNRLAPLQGWRWVIEGFRLMKHMPFALIGLTVFFVLSILLPSVLPLVGSFAPLFLTPALSVGYMQGVRMSARNERPGPLVLFEGFRADGGRHIKALVVLGAINCVLTSAVLAISMFADGGTLFRVATGAIASDDPSLNDNALVTAALVFGALYAPVQMSMWYAPLFVVWHGQTAAKAMFFSLVAVWRNKWVFAVFMLGWFAIAVAASLGVQLLRGVVGSTVMTLLVTPLSLVMLSSLYCSFWPTYRDAIAAPSNAPDAPDEHQTID
ncbi:MAG: hypothetical protein RLZ51_56 [Pseudomonadota bacterium]